MAEEKETKQEEVKEEEQKPEDQEEKKEEASKEETPKEETPKEEALQPEAEEVEVPDKFKDIVENLENMTVVDLADLVGVLEKKFGVSAIAPAAAAGGSGGGDDESSEANLVLEAAGDQKIQVIKAVKEITGLGLKEAKDIVDGAPKSIKEGVNREEAEEMKKQLEEAGATVSLK